MASSIAYSQIDDKDLDDAALWAVIDSASASHSSTKSKSLAIKYPNFPSPSPISKPSPPAKFPRISTESYSADGEVVHEPWSYRPPRKIARTCPSASETSPLALVKNVVQRTPPPPPPHAVVYSSPEAHLSPQLGRFRVQEIISPCSENAIERICDQSKGKENGSHGFPGRFSSVSLFKEYQNTAMAVSLNL